MWEGFRVRTRLFRCKINLDQLKNRFTLMIFFALPLAIIPGRLKAESTETDGTTFSSTLYTGPILGLASGSILTFLQASSHIFEFRRYEMVTDAADWGKVIDDPSWSFGDRFPATDAQLTFASFWSNSSVKHPFSHKLDGHSSYNYRNTYDRVSKIRTFAKSTTIKDTDDKRNNLTSESLQCSQSSWYATVNGDSSCPTPFSRSERNWVWYTRPKPVHEVGTNQVIGGSKKSAYSSSHLQTSETSHVKSSRTYRLRNTGLSRVAANVIATKSDFSGIVLSTRTIPPGQSTDVTVSSAMVGLDSSPEFDIASISVNGIPECRHTLADTCPVGEMELDWPPNNGSPPPETFNCVDFSYHLVKCAKEKLKVNDALILAGQCDRGMGHAMVVMPQNALCSPEKNITCLIEPQWVSPSKGDGVVGCWAGPMPTIPTLEELNARQGLKNLPKFVSDELCRGCAPGATCRIWAVPYEIWGQTGFVDNTQWCTP